jgi:hypothetical protein
MKFEASIQNLKCRRLPDLDRAIDQTEEDCEHLQALTESLAAMKAAREELRAELAALERLAFEGRAP